MNARVAPPETDKARPPLTTFAGEKAVFRRETAEDREAREFIDLRCQKVRCALTTVTSGVTFSDDGMVDDGLAKAAEHLRAAIELRNEHKRAQIARAERQEQTELDRRREQARDNAKWQPSAAQKAESEMRMQAAE